MKPRNECYRALSNEMAACIDTGNQGQAEHCLALAESYLDDGKINVQHRADIQADFDQGFPDAGLISSTAIEVARAKEIAKSAKE